ncbi:DUF3025 domain-containing protein [Rhodoferax sp.]|jgi:hypothetical protein|uniref:DUF3025 domain-containing protein n=1 Tax=Rhodoferax sp. TaxID=50421 RepID=UPI0037852BB7
MAAGDGLDLDWSAPWLAPWRALGEPVAQRIRAGQSCVQALNAFNTEHGFTHQHKLQQGQGRGEPLAPKVFVAQSQLPPGVAYEQFIFETSQVPTRDGLHDFFNGLCWMRFPHTKLRLNALQAQQIARTGVQPVRGPTRDALTVIDENAALLQTPDVLWNALLAKDWQAVFVTHRALWAQSQIVLFGHALLEKLVAPRKAITAHVLRVHTDSPDLTDIDRWLAGALDADLQAVGPMAHLPVLGVPTWWPANTDPGFYADTSVFRPPRSAAGAGISVHSPGHCRENA